MSVCPTCTVWRALPCPLLSPPGAVAFEEDDEDVTSGSEEEESEEDSGNEEEREDFEWDEDEDIEDFEFDDGSTEPATKSARRSSACVSVHGLRSEEAPRQEKELTAAGSQKGGFLPVAGLKRQLAKRSKGTVRVFAYFGDEASPDLQKAASHGLVVRTNGFSYWPCGHTSVHLVI